MNTKPKISEVLTPTVKSYVNAYLMARAYAWFNHQANCKACQVFDFAQCPTMGAEFHEVCAAITANPNCEKLEATDAPQSIKWRFPDIPRYKRKYSCYPKRLAVRPTIQAITLEH
ncbi:MAG: hypothetical protein NUV74_05590 [Candidatus Brocadiaceae bacterium]|nr:hypothetical protein [Candidatus Brocadiaceae bacterium]